MTCSASGVGIYLDLRNPGRWRRPWPEVYGETLDLAEHAEAAGLDSVWLSEHHCFRDGYLSQPLTFAAAVAARTRFVRIGTSALLLPLRHPVDVAEQTAIVDLLSGGRLELGVTAPYATSDWNAFGLRPADRYGVMERALSKLFELLSEPGLLPKPAQRPVPVWLGFRGPRGARLAGRLGVGLLALERELFAPYLDSFQEAGHPMSGVRMAGPLHVLVCEDVERERSVLEPFVVEQWDGYRIHSGGSSAEPATFEQLTAAGKDGTPAKFVLADPDTAVDLITRTTSGLPIRHVYLWVMLPGLPWADAHRNVDVLARNVVPRIREASSDQKVLDVG
jgi:alkanesulfonate monooxygenase SsuD/methylene tetrahydromethanopterin reductase-like flavin-dependent oxidoreductase (luciferase family)